MLRCTYIVFIYNNENNILKLISSLRKIQGDFNKEFIFLDDGSSDNSLDIIKTSVKDLPRTTIITQNTMGPTLSLNRSLGLATGDYIHFIEGDESVYPEATNILIKACIALGTQVAFGLNSSDDGIIAKDNLENIATLVQNPLYEILSNELPAIRNIGCSGSLIHHSLIDKIGKVDSSIYTYNMSLALLCAKYSKFAFVRDLVSVHLKRDDKKDSNFISYNNIKSIYNFAKNNPEIFVNLSSELLKNLSREIIDSKSKFRYNLMSISSKYLKHTSLDKILEYYKQEFNSLL